MEERSRAPAQVGARWRKHSLAYGARLGARICFGLRSPLDILPSPYKFIGFGAIAITKPYKFIGFGAIAITKPYKFTGFGAIAITKPYKFIGSGALDVTKPYKFIGFGTRQLLGTTTTYHLKATCPSPARAREGKPSDMMQRWARRSAATKAHAIAKPPSEGDMLRSRRQVEK